MDENIRMEDLLAEENLTERKDVQGGKINELPIAAFTADSVLIDLGWKSEAIIPKSEFDEEALKNLKIGDKISVFVSGQPNSKVSHRKAVEILNWQLILETKRAAKVITVKIKNRVKGGYTALFNGIEVFLPASQADIKPVENLDSLVGSDLQALIIEADRNKNNVVVSHRKILEQEREIKKKEILANIKVGDIVKGVVLRMAQYGAFLDIGGMDALLRESEFSWDKNEKIGKTIKIGDELDLKVVEINEQDGRVALSRKAMLPHPWDGIESRFPVNSSADGLITSITNFGIFVQLDKGVEGLVHSSEVSWLEKAPELKNKYKKGDMVKALVTGVDVENKKISLSLKRLQANPWEEAAKLYPAGARLKGKITRIAPFGAFVELPNKLEGLIHLSDMDWMNKIRNPKDILKEGDITEFVVKSVIPKEEKIALSIKELKENPFVKYRVGKVVEGVVKKMLNFGVFVALEDGVDAFMHISEIYSGNEDPKYRMKHPNERLKEGQKINAKVIKSSQAERSIEISEKKYERDMEKEEIKKYLNSNNRTTLGDLFGIDENS